MPKHGDYWVCTYTAILMPREVAATWKTEEKAARMKLVRMRKKKNRMEMSRLKKKKNRKRFKRRKMTTALSAKDTFYGLL
jgi:hypothetical protein